MESSLIKIGNSQGFIIPKKILNKFGSTKKFIIQEKDGSLLFVPVKEEKPRENWDQLFAQGKKKELNRKTTPLKMSPMSLIIQNGHGKTI